MVTKELPFTYANAGYIKLGYGTIITFSAQDSSDGYDSMTIRRFSIESIAPETEIGFTGKSNPFTVKLKRTSAHFVESRRS